MATPATLSGTQLLIKVGNGASPEVFAHPCLINGARSIEFRSTTNDIIVPDCTNPDDPAWRELMKDGLSASITGSGIMDNNGITVNRYTEWFVSQDPTNIEVWLGTVGHWDGAFKLTGMTFTGERNNKILVDLTIESDGPVDDWVTA